MKKNPFIVLFTCVVSGISLFSQENFKVMFYNLLEQILNTFYINQSVNLSIDIMNLTKGIYYIKTLYLNVEPIKLFKIN